MKKYLLLLTLLLVAGCGRVPDDSVAQESEVSSATYPGAGYRAAWEALAGSSESMAVLSWSCNLTNAYAVPTKAVIIDCLNDEGEVLAQWDMVLHLQPGESAKASGKFDVPAKVAKETVTVLVQLVTTGG